ncbi:MAG: DUF1660 family phage protein [Thermoplasmata archaeon]
MELECKSCGYEWDYQGESDFYATCPNCHYKVKISAKAEVIKPDFDIDRFDEEENMFLKELATCESSEDFQEVCSKYDQQEFNALRKTIKGKVQEMREDLEKFERAEDVLEGSNWEYPEL